MKQAFGFFFLCIAFIVGGASLSLFSLPGKPSSQEDHPRGKSSLLHGEISVLKTKIVHERRKEQALIELIQVLRDLPKETFCAPVSSAALQPILQKTASAPAAPPQSLDPRFLLEDLQEALSEGRMDDVESLSLRIAQEGKDVLTLLEILIHSQPDPLLKLQILKILSEMKLAESVPILQSILFQEKSILLWREALNALLSIGALGEEDKHFENLLINLLHSGIPDIMVREQIITVLASRESPEAMHALQQMAAYDPHPSVRHKAIKLLAKKKDPSLLPLFEEILWNEPCEENKKAAILALIYMGDLNAIPILESCLNVVWNPLLRSYLEMAIEKIIKNYYR